MSYQEMEAMISTWPDQLRWGASLEVPEISPPSQVLICGMGGSGISGDYAAALSSVPVAVHKGYGTTSWAAGSRPLVVAVSYSGNTEETLSAVDEAVALGLDLAAVTGGGQLGGRAREAGWALLEVPGGLQPRAALGYLLGGVLAVLRAAQVTMVEPEALLATAELASTLLTDGGAARLLASDLAQGLDGRIAGIYGSAGLVAPAAQRWKTQINENAKWPAWWSVMPELDHNEIVSWTSLSELTKRRVGIIALRDQGEGASIAARFRHTEAVIAGDVDWVGEVWSQGTTPLERLVSLTIVGDLVSLELARVAGVDPVPVAAIEDLKRKLAEESP